MFSFEYFERISEISQLWSLLRPVKWLRKSFSNGETKHDLRLIRRKLTRKPRYIPITAIQVQKKLNEYNGK